MNISWSGRGEDIVLNRFYKNIKYGIYMDIGCARPKDGNLTYSLYKQGWNGIAIDARCGLKKEWEKLRPRDIQIFMPLTKNSREYAIEYNGFRTKLLIKSDSTFEKVQSLSVTDFVSIYQQNFRRNPDLIKIDIEGFEYNVLRALLNQGIFADIYIIEVVDQIGSNFSVRPDTPKIMRIMNQYDYILRLNDGVNLWFASKSFKPKMLNYWAPPYPGSQEKYIPDHLTIKNQVKFFLIRYLGYKFWSRLFK